jgi:hypothetical protein
MHTRTIAIMAGLILSLAVTAASANKLSISNRNVRIAWNPLVLSNTGLGGINLSCGVTMEGSFHSATIAKTVGALVGFVTRSTAGGCTNGTATIDQTALPWHVRYGGFEGTLPTITGVTLNISGVRFIAERGGSTCATTTTVSQPGVGIARTGGGGVITGLRMDETRTIPLSREGLCSFAGEGRFAGTGVVTGLGATTTLSVRLI